MLENTLHIRVQNNLVILIWIMNSPKKLESGSLDSVGFHKRKHEEISNEISESIDGMEGELDKLLKQLCNNIKEHFKRRHTVIGENIEELDRACKSLANAALRLSQFREQFTEFQKSTVRVLISDTYPTDNPN